MTARAYISMKFARNLSYLHAGVEQTKVGMLSKHVTLRHRKAFFIPTAKNRRLGKQT
jgi:hypothetical protein